MKGGTKVLLGGEYPLSKLSILCMVCVWHHLLYRVEHFIGPYSKTLWRVLEVVLKSHFRQAVKEYRELSIVAPLGDQKNVSLPNHIEVIDIDHCH